MVIAAKPKMKAKGASSIRKIHFALFILVGISMVALAGNLISVAYIDWDINESGFDNVLRESVSMRTKPSCPPPLHHHHHHHPEVVWLMTHPNSGTSYTLRMVETSTNTSTANNYAQDFIKEPFSTSIYHGSHEGPYFNGTSLLPLPEKYVLTKTHCAHIGNWKAATVNAFLDHCTRTVAVMNSGRMQTQWNSAYDRKRVKKIIRLVRDPLHNMISNFHHEAGGKTIEHFRKWCTSTPFEGENLICRKRIHQYTRWHNLANEAIESMAVEALTVHYESYNTTFESTCRSILDFLELTPVVPFPTFSLSRYDGYFTREEWIRIGRLIRSEASNATWNDVKHYFKSGYFES